MHYAASCIFKILNKNNISKNRVHNSDFMFFM